MLNKSIFTETKFRLKFMWRYNAFIIVTDFIRCSLWLGCFFWFVGFYWFEHSTWCTGEMMYTSSLTIVKLFSSVCVDVWWGSCEQRPAELLGVSQVCFGKRHRFWGNTFLQDQAFVSHTLIKIFIEAFPSCLNTHSGLWNEGSFTSLF